MILQLIFFLAGGILGTALMYTMHNARIRTMKADVTAALMEQAQESFRLGYYRGMTDEKTDQIEKESKHGKIYASLR